MSHDSSSQQDLVRLESGEVLFDAGATGMVWQLESGAIRLDRMEREGARFVHLALPGDLLGLELLAAYPYAYTARAIVPCVARQKQLPSEAQRRMALIEGLLQQQRRSEDVVRLRSGAAQDRLKHLLLALTPEGTSWTGEETCALPTIKDMAAIIDTAPETVSRIFANLKRTQILAGRQRQGASYSLSRLVQAEWPTGMTRSDGSQRLGVVSPT